MSFRQHWETRARTDYYEYFNDFIAPTDYDTSDWTLTTVEAGASSATEAIGNIAGGVLVVTNDTADDDSDFFQSTKEVFKYVSGKALEFAIRFKLSDVVDSDFVAGLQIIDTSPLAVSDGIFFRKNDGDSYPDLVICKNGAETVVALPNPLVNDTFVKLGFYYDGSVAQAAAIGQSSPTVDIYVDDTRVGALTIDSNMPDDEELAVSFGIQNGAAASKVLSVDYIQVVAER